MAEMSFLAKFELDNANALNKIEDLKKALADQQAILAKTKEVFGEFSSEYVLQSSKVDEATKNLNDGIKDAAKNINDLKVTGGEVWESFNKAFAGLKGGLGSLNGLLQLFGEQNEEVGAALEKVQAVMDFTDAIEGIKNAGEGFKNFGSVLGEVATKGFGAIKTAIIETGIGALVIGLTLVISKLWDWISGNAAAKKAQDDLKASTEKINSTLKDHQTELSNAERLAVSRAKASGASEEQIFKTQQLYARQNTQLLQNAIKEKEESVKKFEQFRNRDKDSEKAYQDAIRDLKKTQQELDNANVNYEIKENEHKAQQRDEDAQNEQQHAQDRINKKRQAADEELEILTDKSKNDEAIAVAEAKNKGKNEDEIFKIQQDARKKNLDALAAYAEKLKKIYGENSQEYKRAVRAIADAQTDFAVAATNEQTRMAQKQKEATEAQAQIQKQADDELASITEQNNKDKLKAEDETGKKLIEHDFEVQKERIKKLAILEDEQAKLIEQYRIKKDTQLAAIDKQRKEQQDKQASVYVKELNDDESKDGLDEHSIKHNTELDGLKQWYLERRDVLTDNAEAEEKLEKEFSKRKKIIAKEEFDYKLGLTSDLLNQAADLLGKNTVAGKVAAIASATINTYLGATKALATLPPPFSYIQAALTVATGIKNIHSIINTQVPGQTSSGVAPSSVPSAVAPLVPQVQQTNTSLNQDQLNQIGNATVRAFVLESDVSSNQEKIARLNRAARLGG